jgi:hypothetical protein
MMLKWRRCGASWTVLPQFRECGRGATTRMKVLSGWTGGDGARGCRSPPWRRRRGVLVSPSLARSWLLSSGESLDSELDQHDGGVLDVVTLLGASCVKAWLGGSRLLFSGARCCPRLICRGAMHTMAGESKTMSSRN